MLLRNIYSADELEKMDIETEVKYTEIIYRLLEYYPLFEKTKDGNICGEVRRFLVEDLNDCYSTLKELRADIYHVSLAKIKFSSKKLCSLKSYFHSCTPQLWVSAKQTK